MDSVVSRDDARLARVGQLVVDASGNGTITFVVPSLPPGPYALMVYCSSCAQYSAGRAMLPVANFTITPGPSNTATARSEVPLATVVGVILLLGCALSVLGVRMRSN